MTNDKAQSLNKCQMRKNNDQCQMANLKFLKFGFWPLKFGWAFIWYLDFEI
jgi:hypothetical protein